MSEQIIRIRSVVRSVAQAEIDPPADQPLFSSGVLDSFALPDLVSALEQEFGISIPDADLVPQKFASISHIEAYLSSRAA